jgi:hypothetical protein
MIMLNTPPRPFWTAGSYKSAAGCHLSDDNVPGAFTHDVPVIFTQAAPPIFTQTVPA